MRSKSELLTNGDSKYHGDVTKDVALQFLGNIFDYFLNRNNNNQVLNILGATSGDTGRYHYYLNDYFYFLKCCYLWS